MKINTEKNLTECNLNGMQLRYDLVIRNGRVFVEDGLLNADLAVKDGKIAALFLREPDDPGWYKGEKEIDANGLMVLPGTIDPHVHVRAPGKEEREDFRTGTAAAAAGGVTTMIEHPIANPPQYNLEILEKRIAAADKDALVDFAFYGAAGSEYPDQVKELARSGRIVSFKTFLHEAPPGRDEEFRGLTMKNDAAQYDGMKTIGETGVICGVHAENNDMINANIKRLKEEGKTEGIHHCQSRPPVTEYETVSKLLLFAEKTGARIEFCHISTPEAMEMIKRAKVSGLDVYLETCPHYLLMDESYLTSHGPFAKCNPPLRDRESVEKLWDYINDGSVDFIGSDHAPYTYEEKLKGDDDIFACPAGIPCIEMRFPLMMDAVNRGKLSLKRFVELLTEGPAKVFGLYPRKGVIRVGSDADFILVDEKESYEIHTEDMKTKSRASAKVFEGMKLTGKLKTTIVRGEIIMQDGVISEEHHGFGKLILPEAKKEIGKGDEVTL